MVVGHVSATEENSKGVGLLISMLVRYPELATVNLDPRGKLIKFTFILTKPVPERDFESIRDRIRLSIEAYLSFKAVEASTIEVEKTNFSDICVLELRRDMASLTQDEISLVIEIVRDACGELLAADRNDHLLEEDLMIQEEIIDEMLQDVRELRQGKSIVAFREEGRVVVYNK